MSYPVSIDLTKEQIKELKIVAIKEEKTAKQLIREIIIKKLEEQHGQR